MVHEDIVGIENLCFISPLCGGALRGFPLAYVVLFGGFVHPTCLS